MDDEKSSFNIKRIDPRGGALKGLSDSRLWPLLIMAVIIACLALLASGYLYFQYQKAQKQLKAKTQVTTAKEGAKESIDETKKLLEEVGKLIELPKDEEPTIATVTDVEKLKDQPFFKKAKSGDKVFIYPKAQKTILYDPKAKKIIESGFFTTVLSEKELKITVRNGTNKEGLAEEAQEQIKKKYPEAKIVSEWAQQKDTYDKTVVVILDDQATDQAINLAKVFSAQIGDLPKGEDRPKDSKILIILGKDRI